MDSAAAWRPSSRPVRPTEARAAPGSADGRGRRRRGAREPRSGRRQRRGAVYREIDPALIEPNPRQPRQVFDDEAMTELVHSIREFGLMQPIVVRAVDHGARYQIVMGERRWRAAQQAGMTAIPAIVRETGDDSMLRDALLENIHRVQLNPLEEAAAYQQLLDEFGSRTTNWRPGSAGRARSSRT
ncbi:parB/RepB/Spo0J family partition domain protein [Mycobacterium xenopi 4042]|uniref:ParB/RepB/Spo0J family partition domain protein n=1 Tax=Mycobacterium xenopi 4042 TaxID=1299334 RepID=X8CLA0_MYCXE|nr:parB/RepB/Spo0J family partition domain protein [Mycobacterium xenopi 4042]